MLETNGGTRAAAEGSSSKAEEVSAENGVYTESGPLKKEYENGRSPEHSEYVMRIIRDGLDSGKLNKENRIAMWKNYEHLTAHVEKVGEGEDVLQAIETYLRDMNADDSEKPRYPFAKKMLTTNENGEYPGNGLGSHLQEASEYSGQALFKPGTNESRFEGIISSHHAALLADVVAPLHDILKFLGTLDAQVMPDHEIMTAALVRNTFIGKTVTLRGEAYVLNKDDVEFIAKVIEDHENIGDEDYVREEGRDSYIKSEDPAERAKAFFFLIDTQTGVFEFSDDSDEITINEDRLQERFADLYFRHVAKFVYDEATGKSIKTAKIFRPIWGAYAIQDYIALFKEVEESGLKLPDNWQTILVSKALLVLNEAEEEHYQLIENEVAINPETGERYSFNPEDIKEIQKTKRQLVFKMLENFIENLEPKGIHSVEGLRLITEALDTEYESGKVEIKDRDKFIDYLNELLEEAGFFDPSIVAGVDGEKQAKELREKLVGKIMAHPSLFVLDDAMHNQEFLDGAAEISHRGYESRNNLEFDETEELTLDNVEKAASISGLVAIQELLGVFSEQQGIPMEEVIINILEGNLDLPQFTTMITVQKMQYLFSREFSGQAFTREPSFVGDALVEYRKEDWEQIKDNVRYLADWLGMEYEEKNPEQIEDFLSREMPSSSAELHEQSMEELFKKILQNEKQMVDQAILADQRYKEGVIDAMGDAELAKTMLRIIDENEYNWLFDGDYVKSLDKDDLGKIVAGEEWSDIIGDYPPTTELFDDREEVLEVIEKTKRIDQAKKDIKEGREVELEEITDAERGLLELRAVNMVDIYTVMTTMMVYQDAYGQDPEKVLAILNGDGTVEDDQPNEVFDFAQRMAHSFWYSSLFQRMKDRSLTRTAMPYAMLSTGEKDKDGGQVKTGSEVIFNIAITGAMPE